MKNESTVRRELKRINGILQRQDMKGEEKRYLRGQLENYRHTLRWVLDSGRAGWVRPTVMVPLGVRKGER